ncbi:MAG: undecaprenyl/decaprenyl-phosphate alpha-N-acetylglucosaminyl 1-phosphate transferase [Deltaproteobacteria bacterium]|nr:undecaprenyl/decaprenyl-phosphate alpha-N-acetylglucosaminyl 1-phosphate transferase [Deltaproteobacteria bacterium]
MIALALGAAFLCALGLTPLLSRLALRLHLVDIPGQLWRKQHERAVPLAGGTAVWLAFWLALGLWLGLRGAEGHLLPRRWYWGMFLGSSCLMLGGWLDDRLRLPATLSWVFPVGAVVLAAWCGIGEDLKALSNPFGASIPLAVRLLGVPLSGIVTGMWLLGMIYTTKLLDGVDGLVTTVSVLAALVLLVVAFTQQVHQPRAALLAALLAAALAGFLPYNWPPATVFLGEGGSTFLGFMIAAIAVIVDGKIATAVLVMGVPMLDVVAVTISRGLAGQNPFTGDRRHLHFRLLDLGLSPKQAVGLYAAVVAGCGLAAVVVQTFGLWLAFGVLVSVMAVFVTGVHRLRHRPDRGRLEQRYSSGK